MRRVSEETERLMWWVAEEDDPKAIEEFGERFPELRQELLKRIQMVRALKGARAPLSDRHAIPRFAPPASRPWAPSRSAWAVAAFALIALGYASFTVSKRYFSSDRASSRDAPTQQAARSPSSPHQFPSSPRGSPQELPPELQFEPAIRQEEKAPPVLRRSLRFDRIALLDAIRQIGKACGVQVLIAPGMPNPEIVLDYRNMTAAEMLADMAPRFGFTAFEQGDGSLLVIPARDRAESAGARRPDIQAPERQSAGDGPSGASSASEQ